MAENFMTDDIRWIQRFNSYKKALAILEKSVAAAQERYLNEIEEQGLVQGFEFTFELSWKLLKDYLESKGFKDFHGSKDTFKLAFQEGLINNGEIWMEMIDNRNRSSHTYEESIAKEIIFLVLSKYFSKFEELVEKMNSYLPQTYGISQNALDKIKTVLFSKQGVEQVILYGSRAKNNYKEGSDIDLTIKGNLTYDDLVKMSISLDDLNLPWKIDLSLYNQIKNEDLLEHIARVGVTI